MTVRELRWALAHPDINQSAEVRVVYHGYHQRSFNLPAISTQDGESVHAFLILVEEPRDAATT